MIDTILETLEKDMAELDEGLPAPASEREISLLVERAQESMGLVIPDDYLLLLRKVNGFEWNGCILYGSDPEDDSPGLDLVEQNKAWRGDGTERQHLTFLGESSISWFVYDTQDDAYKVLDLPSGDEMSRPSSFAHLVQALVYEAVGIG